MTSEQENMDWPQPGELYGPEELAVKQLIRIARQVASRASMGEQLASEFEQAIEQVEALFENDDPRSNGWVGDDGLP